MEVKKKTFLDNFTIPLGRWFNVPLYLHWSWTFIVLLLLFADFKTGSSNVPVLIGAFFIITLHEFGHCLAAQHFKWKVYHIYLYPIGGAAYMDFQPVPKEELVVAASGPLVNVLLIPFFHLVTIPFFPEDIWTRIGAINIVILLFNLLPIFPMDGGRLLRATLEFRLPRLKATLYATRVGQMCCGGLAVLGFMIGHIMLVFIAGFIALAAQNELDMVRAQEELKTLKEDARNFISNSVDTLEGLQSKIDDYRKDFDR